MTPSVEAVLKPTLASARLIWFGLTFAVPTYGVTAYLMSRGQAPQPIAPAMLLAFVVAAVFSAAFALLLPRFIPPAGSIRQLMAHDPSPESLASDPGTGRVDPARLEAARHLSTEERRLVLVGRLLPVQSVARLALGESIAIYGFVLTFLSKTFEPMIYFAVPALLVLLLCFPRLEPVLDRAEQLRTA